MKIVTVSVTTDAAGDVTAYSTETLGKIVRVFVDIGDLASGAVDFTVTGERTGEAIYTGSNLAADTVADATTAAGVYVWAERIKVVVADGGDTKTGTISFAIVERSN